MIDKYDLWKYGPNTNCWDFVVNFMRDLNVELPKFGICHKDKKAMTKASKGVISSYLVECSAIQNAIACHYHGKLLLHVGVVDNGYVRHAHPKLGMKKDKIKDFEAAAQKTVYRIPKCLT